VAKYIRITWIKSSIGYSKDQKRTIEALGLRHVNQTIQHEDSQSLRGMISKVAHLVKIEEGAKPSETK
jgi:large subunit ribosomal protein L30